MLLVGVSCRDDEHWLGLRLYHRLSTEIQKARDCLALHLHCNRHYVGELSKPKA